MKLTISSMCNSHRGLKVRIIIMIRQAAVAMDSNINNKLGAYLVSILSWNGMSSFLFMFEFLLLTNYVVLRDPRVQTEVINLFKVYKLIVTFPEHRFFRHLGDPQDVICLERNNFDVLVGVAQTLRAHHHKKSIGAFQAVFKDANLVKDLVDMHDEDMALRARAGMPMENSMAHFLTENVYPEDYDEEDEMI